MEVYIAAVAVTVVLFVWVSWTATRVDRLHGRTGLARASLDSALVRRAAALQALAAQSSAQLGPAREAWLLALAGASLDADESTREAVGNDLSRAMRSIPAGADPALLADLTDAARRVALARRFYNDAVRDTVSLRRGRVPRLFRLGGAEPLPAFFEIDDTIPVAPAPVAPSADARGR